MLLILASLACGDLIDLGFSGRFRLISFRKVSGSSLISIPSTMTSPTSMGVDPQRNCIQIPVLVVLVEELLQQQVVTSDEYIRISEVEAERYMA